MDSRVKPDNDNGELGESDRTPCRVAELSEKMHDRERQGAMPD